MGQGVFIEAPCKLNLHLAVGGRRADGYHDLVSLFQQVSLCDGITIETLTDDCGVVLADTDGIPSADNLVRRAAALFLGETGIRRGLRIRLEKRIPMGAGLGGGSSDAAATLRGLDVLFGTNLGTARLAALGARLGSDVPFFCTCACAVVGGRGEKVEPVPGREDFECLIADPGFSVSTPEAYRALDAARSAGMRPTAGMALSGTAICERYREDIRSWAFRNDFFPVVSADRPKLATIVRELEAAGALYAGMTGSGSALFGIFSGGAGRAMERVRKMSRGCFFAIPLACMRNAVVK